MNKYIFDTNIFNRILDGEINISVALKDSEVYVTHIQWDEINNTKNIERRNGLAKIFRTINPKNIPTESAVWDISRWDQAKWPKEDNIFEKIKSRLDEIKKDKNNTKDALIAETAVENKLVLVTEDQNLSRVAKIFGVKSQRLENVLKINIE